MNRRRRERAGRIAESVAAWAQGTPRVRNQARRDATPGGEIDQVGRRGARVQLVEVKRPAAGSPGTLWPT